jgi:hypothetical protein
MERVLVLELEAVSLPWAVVRSTGTRRKVSRFDSFDGAFASLHDVEIETLSSSLGVTPMFLLAEVATDA